MIQKYRDWPIIRVAASIRLYVYLTIFIIIALAVGTLIPQVPGNSTIIPNQQFSSKLLQLTDIYHSWWFTALLVLLALNILACSWENFSLRLNKIGPQLTHAGLVLILAGGAITSLCAQRGPLGLRVGELSNSFGTINPQQLNFSIRLDDFQLQFTEPSEPGRFLAACNAERYCEKFPVVLGREYAIAGYPNKVKIVESYLDLRVDAESKKVIESSNEPRNPALRLELAGSSPPKKIWLFAWYPQMSMNAELNEQLTLFYEFAADSQQISDFVSKLAVVIDGRTVLSKTVRVNDPLRYGGYTFYQSQYNPEDPLWTGLEVVRDPGVPVVWLGFAVVMAGLLVGFYLTPYLSLRERNGGNGTV